jgi:hypothetical protein
MRCFGFDPIPFHTCSNLLGSVDRVVNEEVRMSALALSGYQRPAIAWAGEVAEERPWLVWAVWVFTLSAALAWAAYCVHQGGNPDIDIGWFRIKVSCYR